MVACWLLVWPAMTCQHALEPIFPAPMKIKGLLTLHGRCICWDLADTTSVPAVTCLDETGHDLRGVHVENRIH